MCDRCLLGCPPFVLCGDGSNAEVRETSGNIVDVLQESRRGVSLEGGGSAKRGKGDDMPSIPCSDVKSGVRRKVDIGQENI